MKERLENEVGRSFGAKKKNFSHFQRISSLLPEQHLHHCLIEIMTRSIDFLAGFPIKIGELPRLGASYLIEGRS